jgi:hypothetical protein
MAIIVTIFAQKERIKKAVDGTIKKTILRISKMYSFV